MVLSGVWFLGWIGWDIIFPIRIIVKVWKDLHYILLPCLHTYFARVFYEILCILFVRSRWRVSFPLLALERFLFSVVVYLSFSYSLGSQLFDALHTFGWLSWLVFLSAVYRVLVSCQGQLHCSYDLWSNICV